MTTKRTRDPERTKRHVVDAAAKEFAQKGFDGATLSGIARRARVSKQLLQHHFGSKEALFQQVHDQKFRPAVHWRETLPENPTELMAARFAKRGKDQDYLRFLAWEAASARKRALPGEEDRQRRMSEYGNEIRMMQEKGQLPANMDWRLIQLATLSLATYPIAFPQITRLVMGKEATNAEFQAQWTEFLRTIGAKLFA